MHVDTPATIAVIGAGPVGLEAALYARYLGYDVHVYERGQVGQHLRAFAHVRLFSPWRMNVSPLGLAALSAQDDRWQAPDGQSLPTAGQFVEQYLVTLSQTDLLADCIHEQTEVLYVGRESVRKSDRPGSRARAKRPFRLLLRDRDQRESIATADVVIDATGTYGNPNWAGDGGLPALGERRLRKLAAEQKRSELLLENGLPDILGTQSNAYSGKTVMVIGGGHSAATNVLALVQLAEKAGAGQVVWVMRDVPTGGGPVPRIADDPLAARDRLAVAASEVVHSEYVRFMPGWVVEAFMSEGDQLRVILTQANPMADDEPDDFDELTAADDEPEEGDKDDSASGGAATSARQQTEIVVDRVLANTGYRPDLGVYRELQVQECFASERPIPHGTNRSESQADGLEFSADDPQRLILPEPNFYVLGAKSYGRNGDFLLADGLNQIRDLFRMVGGRDGLDVYRTMSR